MNKTEQHSKTWKRFTNVILVFEQNSHSGKRICEDKRSAHGIFCEDNSHSLKFDGDLASHEGQWLPHRDASVQHKSKETRLGEGQERNQEEGGGVERGKGGGFKGLLDYFPKIRLLWYPDPSLRFSCDIFSIEYFRGKSQNVIFLAIEHSRRHARWSTAPQKRHRKISTRHSRSSNWRPRSLQACSNSARQWMDWCTWQLMSEQCRTLQCCDGKTKCYNRPTNKNKTTGPHLLWVVPRVWLYTSGRGERYFMFQILVTM